MAMRIAINGFGRIGRLVYRIIHSDYPDVEVVAVNDLVPSDNLAYLLKYDTVHGRPAFKVEAEEKSLVVDGKRTQIFTEKEPANLPWKALNIDYVVESTGFFTK